MIEWAVMPNRWIQSPPHGLTDFRWAGNGASETAALMLYIALVHHANREPEHGRATPGFVDLYYSRLAEITCLSRAKIAGGLAILDQRGVVNRHSSHGGNLYQIAHFDVTGHYAKLPARGLYDSRLAHIRAFQGFRLRKKEELNLLKLYLLLVAIRDRNRNIAQISYDKITSHTGIQRNDVKQALNLLVLNELVHVESVQSDFEPENPTNIYRIRHLDNRVHRGTIARTTASITDASEIDLS